MNARKLIIGTALIFLALSGQSLFAEAADDAALADKVKTKLNADPTISKAYVVAARGGSSGASRRDTDSAVDARNDLSETRTSNDSLTTPNTPGDSARIETRRDNPDTNGTNIDNNLNNRLTPGIDQPGTNTEINNQTNINTDNGSSATTQTPPNSNPATTNPQVVTNPNTTTGRPNTMPGSTSP